MRMRLKKISCILSAALMIFMLPVTAMAEETGANSTIETDAGSLLDNEILTPVESETLGSITVKLEDTSQNRSKEGVSLAIVQVADVVDGEFVLKNEFAASGVDLNNIENANALEQAAEKLQKINVANKEIITTNEEGIAVASDLHVGVYLIYATDIARYENISTALVSIPTYDSKAGMMNYDVSVIPKHSPLPGKITTDIPGIIQTGVNDNFLEYAAVATALLVTAGIIIVTAKKKMRKSK